MGGFLFIASSQQHRRCDALPVALCGLLGALGNKCGRRDASNKQEVSRPRLRSSELLLFSSTSVSCCEFLPLPLSLSLTLREMLGRAARLHTSARRRACIILLHSVQFIQSAIVVFFPFLAGSRGETAKIRRVSWWVGARARGVNSRVPESFSFQGSNRSWIC